MYIPRLLIRLFPIPASPRRPPSPPWVPSSPRGLWRLQVRESGSIRTWIWPALLASGKNIGLPVFLVGTALHFLETSKVGQADGMGTHSPIKLAKAKRFCHSWPHAGWAKQKGFVLEVRFTGIINRGVVFGGFREYWVVTHFLKVEGKEELSDCRDQGVRWLLALLVC